VDEDDASLVARALGIEPDWRQAVTFRAICDAGWTGLAGQRLPLQETAAVVEALVGDPERPGRGPEQSRPQPV
jgi:hypothetical protein